MVRAVCGHKPGTPVQGVLYLSVGKVVGEELIHLLLRNAC